MRSTAFWSSERTVTTKPGMAMSGHIVQHLAQPVQFSRMNSGYSSRMLVISRNTLVAAGMTL